MENHVPAGVEQTAYAKADFLAAIAKGETASPPIGNVKAVEQLGTMLGGYNIQPLIAALNIDTLTSTPVKSLLDTLLMLDALHDVNESVCDG
mgnify:FL=1